MRFNDKGKIEGRNRAALVDSVQILKAGRQGLATAPRAPASRKLSFKGNAKNALGGGDTPDRGTLPHHGAEGQPETGPGLRLPRRPARRVKITAESDNVKLATVMEDDDRAPPVNGRRRSWTSSAFEGRVTEITITADWRLFSDGQLSGHWRRPPSYTPAVSDGATEPLAKGKPAKNVLVYLIDTMRYDKFGVYNKKSSTHTPNIDAFAKDGTIFDAA